MGLWDGEAQLFVAALEEFQAERVEGGRGDLARGLLADQLGDAPGHLEGGLLGEGDGQDALRADAVLDQVGEAPGEHRRLAGSGSGDHQNGAVEGRDGVVLLRVEAFEQGIGKAELGHEKVTGREVGAGRSYHDRPGRTRRLACGGKWPDGSRARVIAEPLRGVQCAKEEP
ncbi:hypothetical protein D3C87_983170 [compost metagenome]